MLQQRLKSFDKKPHAEHWWASAIVVHVSSCSAGRLNPTSLGTQIPSKRVHSKRIPKFTKTFHGILNYCSIQCRTGNFRIFGRMESALSFHVFPKDNRLRRAWIQAFRRTSLPKKVPVCVRSISMLYCFEYTARLQNELLGLCPWKQNLNLRLFPQSFHTNQPDLYTVYTSGVSCHCGSVATSWVL